MRTPVLSRISMMVLTAFVCLCLNAQENEPSAIFTNIMLTAQPDKMMELEAGIAEHNEMYHKEGVSGARVYWIANGTNADKYMWVMGPHPWSAWDEISEQEGHMEHWVTKVLAFTQGNTVTHMWKFHPDLSNFGRDFNLKYLNVWGADIKHMKNQPFMDAMKNVVKVYKEKMPNELFGIYTNTMPNRDGSDFAWVTFFDKASWMDQSQDFVKMYNEVHGPNSFHMMLDRFGESSEAINVEMWMYREDLSGLGSLVESSARQ